MNRLRLGSKHETLEEFLRGLIFWRRVKRPGVGIEVHRHFTRHLIELGTTKFYRISRVQSGHSHFQMTVALIEGQYIMQQRDLRFILQVHHIYSRVVIQDAPSFCSMQAHMGTL